MKLLEHTRRLELREFVPWFECELYYDRHDEDAPWQFSFGFGVGRKSLGEEPVYVGWVWEVSERLARRIIFFLPIKSYPGPLI